MTETRAEGTRRELVRPFPHRERGSTAPTYRADRAQSIEPLQCDGGGTHSSPGRLDRPRTMRRIRRAGRRPADALPDYRRALEIREGAYGADAVRTAESGVALAEALRQAGRAAEATEAIERWLPPLRDQLGDDHTSVRQAERTRAKVGGGR